MKKVLSLLFFIVLLALSMSFAAVAQQQMAPALIYRFDTQDAVDSFKNGYSSAEVSFENSTLKAVVKAGTTCDPYVTHSFSGDNSYADDYRYLKYRFKTTAQPTMYCYEFYYKTEKFTTMGEKNTYVRRALTGSEDWQEVIVDMKELGGELWGGKLEILRFDPLEAHDRSKFNAGDTVYVEYIALFATMAEAQAYNGESADEWVCPEGIEPETDIAPADDSDYIVWEFETEQEVEKWLPAGIEINKNKTHQIVGLSNGILGLWDDDDNFFFKYTLPENERFTLSKFPFVKIRYRQSHASGVDMQIYFWNTLQSGNPYINVRAENALDWETVTLNYSAGTGAGMVSGFTWDGVLTSLRFDPMREFKQNNPREFYIDYIGFFKTENDANAYAADRNTEFGKDAISVLRYNKQRVVIPANSKEKYFDAFQYVVPYDDVNLADFNKTVNAEGIPLPISYYNGKMVSFMSQGKGELTYSPRSISFGDIENHWGENDISIAALNGLFNGTSENEFSPDMPLSRGMFITVLGRFAGVDAANYMNMQKFSDVNSGEYYAPYICWAAEQGIIESSDRFCPEEAITRKQMACITDAFMKKSGYLFDSALFSECNFDDISALTQQEKNAVVSIAEAGIIKGKNNSKFDPDGKLTRAEACTVFVRLTKSLLHISAVKDYVRYNAAEMTVPYWKGDKVYYESFLPTREKEGEEIEVQLLYDIDEVISLKNGLLDTEYIYGKDYTVRDGKLYIPVDSSIVCMTNSELHPIEGTYLDVINGGFLFTGDRGKSHSRQCAVTYTHSDSWQGDYPVSNPEKLTGFKEKVRNGEEVTIAMFGDSISTGCDSSGLETVNLPPFLPKFIDLVAECLENEYGGKVNVINRSKGGMYAQWGADNVSELFKNDSFDLFVIAFGMNDGTLKVDGIVYRDYIEDIMRAAWVINPDCEILLISTTIPNPASSFAKYLDDGTSYHDSYEPLLQDLSRKYGSQAEIFKLTSMHNYMLTRKRFVDFTSSNINHPNDFLIRLYAQGILELIK
ncbi:MAG: hypothetical protein E7588_01345 [Ruminococcaceae bacterium]|nr:hypothetical protein [Oscillospiraceae bacterium]